MSLSEQTGSSALDKSIEEAWLLWKLNEKAKARELLEPLIIGHPENSQLLQLCAIIYLDAEETAKAADIIDRLEAILHDDITVRELKAPLLLQQRRYQDALSQYEYLLGIRPDNWDYRRDYAYLLSQLKMWRKAKDAYLRLIPDGPRRKDIIWDYRQANTQASTVFTSYFEYLLGPESLRHYIFNEDVRFWINDNVRATIRLFEEKYKKRALGDTPAVTKYLPGHRLEAEYLINEMLTVYGDWETVYRNLEDFHELGGGLNIDLPGMRYNIEYDHDRLVRDPIEGLEKIARMDSLHGSAEILISDVLTAGHYAEMQWFRVDPQENRINSKESLGDKLINDSFLNLRLLSEPYISCNFHYRRGNWQKSFPEAETVLDLIKNEGIYYGGFYVEQRLAGIAQISGSASRNYDHLRDFYYNTFNCALDMWPADSVRIRLTYEFGYEVQGTTGSGNTQITGAELKILF